MLDIAEELILASFCSQQL